MAVLLGLMVAASFGSGDFLGGRTSARSSMPGVLLIVQLSAMVGAVVVAVVVSADVSGSDLGNGGVAGALNVVALGLLYLGLASGRTITLDDNAAGWGWFVDRTPGSDSEFLRPGDQGEQNRIDLLSVLMHEVGHLLGREHDADGVMGATLVAGVRENPEPPAATTTVLPSLRGLIGPTIAERLPLWWAIDVRR